MSLQFCLMVSLILGGHGFIYLIKRFVLVAAIVEQHTSMKLRMLCIMTHGFHVVL